MFQENVIYKNRWWFGFGPKPYRLHRPLYRLCKYFDLEIVLNMYKLLFVILKIKIADKLKNECKT